MGNKSFLYITIQSAIGSFFNIITALIVSVFSARTLAPYDYGQIVLLIFISEAITVLFGFGINTNLSIHISKLIGENKHRICFNFIKWNLRNYLFLTLLGFSFFLIYLFFFAEFAINYIAKILILIYFINKSLSNFLLAVLSGYLEFKLIKKYNLYYGVLLIFLLFVGIYFFTFNGALLAYCLSSFIYLFFTKNSLKKYLSGNINISYQLKKNTFIDSFNIWITLVISLFVWNRLEIIFIKYYWNSNLVGIYNVAMSFALLISTIPTLLTTSLTNHISNNTANLAVSNNKNIYVTGTRVLSAIMIPLSFFTAASLSTIIPFVYGIKYKDSIFITEILTINAILQVGVVGSSILFGLKELKIIVVSGIIGVVMSLIMLFVFVPIYGLNGAVFTKVFVQFSMIFIGHYYLNKKLGTKFPFIVLLKILIISVFLCIPIYYVSIFYNTILTLIIVFILVLLIYILSILNLNILPFEDRNLIKKIFINNKKQ